MRSALILAAWDTSPAAVAVVWGPDHRLIYQDGASRATFGNKQYGVPLAEAFSGSNRDSLATLDDVLCTGQTIDVLAPSVSVRHLLGNQVTMHYVLAPLGSVGSSAIGVVITAVDVSAELQLGLATTRSRLLAEISEQLNVAPNPLSALPSLVRHAGSEDVEVGGDWWDVVELGAGRVALGVGHDSDRGIPAAIVMGPARAAMRAAGLAHLSPTDVLSVLDAQIEKLVRVNGHDRGLLLASRRPCMRSTNLPKRVCGWRTQVICPSKSPPGHRSESAVGRRSALRSRWDPRWRCSPIASSSPRPKTAMKESGC